VIGEARTEAGVQAAIAVRDLHGVAWAMLARAAAGEEPNASMVTGLIRVLASLGPAPADEESVLKETALRGLLMSGLTPRDDDEWALAEAVFDEKTVADLRRRDASLRRLM
jgi:hypothetical protein